MHASRCLAIAALTGCAIDPTFPAELDGRTDDPTLRLAAHVHQREVDGAPQTMIEVWVARTTDTSTPPPLEALVRDAAVEVGDGTRVAAAAPVEDERGLRYVATVDRWLADVAVTARVGAAEIAITHAPLIADPAAMDVRFPEVAIVGGTHALTWDAEGRPVRPVVMVTRAEPPVQFTLLAAPLGGETGRVDMPAATFPHAGSYAVNLVRTVDYAASALDGNISLAATSYWHRTVAAVPRRPQ